MHELLAATHTENEPERTKEWEKFMLFLSGIRVNLFEEIVLYVSHESFTLDAAVWLPEPPPPRCRTTESAAHRHASWSTSAG